MSTPDTSNVSEIMSGYQNLGYVYNIVGSLSSDESAVFLNSVPYWYHVRLDDGTEGFVSKAWTIRMREGGNGDETISIASWNIEDFGGARPMMPQE
jgi:hypothetical protein